MYKSNQGGIWTTHDEQKFIKNMGMCGAKSIKELSPGRRAYRRECLAGYILADTRCPRNWGEIDKNECLSLATELIEEIDALNASGSIGAAA